MKSSETSGLKWFVHLYDTITASCIIEEEMEVTFSSQTLFDVPKFRS